jgi:site-specific DNA-methyltransferase (adenine-specific)
MKTNCVYHGDCLDLLPSIPSKSVDMVLCDLPYGTTACSWDSIIPLDRLWREYERVIKDNGNIVLTANAKFTILLAYSNLKLFRYKWVWMKNNVTKFLQAKKMPLGKHEDVLVFFKEWGGAYNPQKTPCKPYTTKHKNSIIAPNQTRDKGRVRTDTINDGWAYPTDIIQISQDTDKTHPTQKPVALFEYLIRTYSNEGEVILDNCSGSGTTAIACLNSNRQYICIEKDETYYKRSLERIANHEPLLHMGK